MPELPNLLRQRLAATETGETQAHPDADMLTAYMEQSLAPAESKTVIAHLAVCEPCREVVALSQAVMAPAETQTVLEAGPGSTLAKAVYPRIWRGCRSGCHGSDRRYGASASAEPSAAEFNGRDDEQCGGEQSRSATGAGNATGKSSFRSGSSCTCGTESSRTNTASRYASNSGQS